MGIYQDPSAQKDSSGIAGLSTSTPSPFSVQVVAEIPTTPFRVNGEDKR